MPAPVPPGYTRGPILFVGAPGDPTQDNALYQWFWDEAGGFGARILLLVVGAPAPAAADILQARLAEWECDRLTTRHLPDRMAAYDPALVTQVEQATAIALWAAHDRAIGPIFGGTPPAQAIRRANARSKAVAGFGPAAAFLCQHMLLSQARNSTPPAHATMQDQVAHATSQDLVAHAAIQDQVAHATIQDQVRFAPGLGLFNRLVVDVSDDAPAPLRLVGAIAHNPFLVAIGLAPGSAAILYPDETLQALGAPGVDLVEGSAVTAVDLAAPPTLDAVTGACTYHLQQGDGFNLDDRCLRPGGDVDLPPVSPPRTTF